jgi:hypothetical protein
MPLGATTILNLSKRNSHLQPLLLPRRKLRLMLGQGDLVVKYSKAEPHATGRTRSNGTCPDRFRAKRIGAVFYAHDLPHPAHGRDVKPKEKQQQE